jgi:hypothetical protein
MSSHPRLVWFFTVVLSLALACGPITNATPPTPTSGTTFSTESASVPATISSGESTTQSIHPTPELINVQITLDTANAQTGAAPTELIIQNNGMQYVLLIPGIMVSQEADGTLVPAYDSPVTMTPVSTIKGIPFSQGFLAAVQFTPDGLLMVKPAMLMLTIPGDYSPGELVGFVWDGNGNNFHVYPATIMSGGGQTVAIFDVLHFSGGGVALLTPEEQAYFVDQLAIDELLRLEHERIQPNIDRLDNLEGSCNDVDVSAQEFITWHSHVIQAGVSQFELVISHDLAILRSRLNSCLKDTCQICLGKPPLNKQSVNAFLVHAFYAEHSQLSRRIQARQPGGMSWLMNAQIMPIYHYPTW